MSEIIVHSDIRQNKTYDRVILYNLDAINQSIMNILVTNPGERLFLPEFGVGLKRYLFELPSMDSESEIMNNIVGSITRWETRVELMEDLSSVTFDNSSLSYHINLVFNVPSLSIKGYQLSVIAPLEIS